MPGRALTGVVLAGGNSSRLGRDKAALRLEGPDGLDLLERAVHLLRGLCGQVLIAGRCHGVLPYLLDAAPGLGPAGGIAAALFATGGPCLVLACDMPFMDAPTMASLLEARASRPRGTLLTAYRELASGRVQSLAAVYESGCLPYLAPGGEGRVPPLHSLPPLGRSHFLPYDQSRAPAFFNLNRPQDLEAALAIMRRRGGQTAGAGLEAHFPAQLPLPVDGSASR